MMDAPIPKAQIQPEMVEEPPGIIEKETVEEKVIEETIVEEKPLKKQLLKKSK